MLVEVSSGFRMKMGGLVGVLLIGEIELGSLDHGGAEHAELSEFLDEG